MQPSWLAKGTLRIELLDRRLVLPWAMDTPFHSPPLHSHLKASPEPKRRAQELLSPHEALAEAGHQRGASPQHQVQRQKARGAGAEARPQRPGAQLQQRRAQQHGLPGGRAQPGERRVRQRPRQARLRRPAAPRSPTPRAAPCGRRPPRPAAARAPAASAGTGRPRGRPKRRSRPESRRLRRGRWAKTHLHHTPSHDIFLYLLYVYLNE